MEEIPQTRLKIEKIRIGMALIFDLGILRNSLADGGGGMAGCITIPPLWYTELSATIISDLSLIQNLLK